MGPLQLRAGRSDEARLLSDLALRSKSYWGYDQAFLDACRPELTLTPEQVERQRVTVAERDGRVVGFYALAGQPPDGVLEQLFVEPDHIGSGIGRALWRHAVQVASRLGFQRLTLDADLGAEPFYWRWGPAAAAWCPQAPSPARVIPQLEHEISKVKSGPA
jgi:GNAT superfamily N-acetyltransferase